MELTESRQPGEAWARHRGARAGVFGEAPRGREIVQASIPPTSRPLQPWRRSPGRAAADRFANACGAALSQSPPIVSPIHAARLLRKRLQRVVAPAEPHLDLLCPALCAS